MRRGVQEVGGKYSRNVLHPMSAGETRCSLKATPQWSTRLEELSWLTPDDRRYPPEVGSHTHFAIWGWQLCPRGRQP